MAQNTRVRLDPDIEAYVRSQSERVIGIPAEQIVGADLTTLTNRLLYEHKFTQKLIPIMQQEGAPKISVEPSHAHQIVPIAPAHPIQKPAPQPLDDLEFAANFAAQFDEESTAA